ncbi:hypothetical protein [Streptococcus suis]
MNKLTQIFKTSNKEGLYLSLIWFMSGFIKLLSLGQHLVILAIFLGTMTIYIPQENREIALKVIELLLLFQLFFYVSRILARKEWRNLLRSFLYLFSLLFFHKGAVHAGQVNLTDIHSLFFSSFVVVVFGFIFQPKLFNYYLLKTVIHKDYLGRDLFVDVDIKDSNKRLKQINQRSIYYPYQKFVELRSFKNENETGLVVQSESFLKYKNRFYKDTSRTCYLVFALYPFGKNIGIYHPLARYTLYQNLREVF